MRRIFVLVHQTARTRALEAVRGAPDGWVVEVKPATRTLEQNARMWAMLADVARQVEWYGRRLSAEDWKHMFTASLYRQDVVPGIDGGFVVLGRSTSRMGRREMGDLIDLMFAFGAERGVRWSGTEAGR